MKRSDALAFNVHDDVSPWELCAKGFELLSEAARRIEQSGTLARAGAGDVFTTRKGFGPPELSPRRWRAIAPTIPGAYRVGRWWVVAKSEYFKFAQDASRRRVEKKPPAKTEAKKEAWSPEVALAKAGIGRR